MPSDAIRSIQRLVEQTMTVRGMQTPFALVSFFFFFSPLFSFYGVYFQCTVIDMICASTCTASLANVCLGDDVLVIEMTNLTLVEYRDHSEATFHTQFGG